MKKTDSICNILEENLLMSDGLGSTRKSHCNKQVLDAGDVEKELDVDDNESLTSNVSSDYNIEKGLQKQLLSPKQARKSKIRNAKGRNATREEPEDTELMRVEEILSSSESAEERTPNRFEGNKKKREEITKKLVYDKKDMNDKYFCFLKSYEGLLEKNRGSLKKRSAKRQKELQIQNSLLDKKNRSIFAMYSKTRCKAKKNSFASVLESYFTGQIDDTLNQNTQIMETKQ